MAWIKGLVGSCNGITKRYCLQMINGSSSSTFFDPEYHWVTPNRGLLGIKFDCIRHSQTYTCVCYVPLFSIPFYCNGISYPQCTMPIYHDIYKHYVGGLISYTNIRSRCSDTPYCTWTDYCIPFSISCSTTDGTGVKSLSFNLPVIIYTSAVYINNVRWYWLYTSVAASGRCTCGGRITSSNTGNRLDNCIIQYGGGCFNTSLIACLCGYASMDGHGIYSITSAGVLCLCIYSRMRYAICESNSSTISYYDRCWY